ncbi:universal stress protein [Spirosoma validum]|uniref:Universal stress protein n=1 Tax=Spirosoma validum TaxID=2771355 RepID=A0A927GGB4_9BACT|nr:universal stress protein [Spirosoma validum]MBD2756533.1 universal stress protein [Spirosoma validum]
MKTIILATDFSTHANHAARFAGQLAKDQKAILILLHAFHVWPDNPAKTGDFLLSMKAERESSEKSLNRLAVELHEELGTDVVIRCIAQEGHTLNAIRSVTKTEQADLLIMSTVGTAPQSTRLMGSVATEMVAETQVPLLLIPPGSTYVGVKNVVLGIDLSTPPNAVALDTALRFARLFNSVINVLCISDTPDEAATKHKGEHIRHLLNPQPHTLTIESGEKIYDTLLDFAHANKADLIMMLPQMRNWLWKLFAEGETQRMARLTDIPLLAVV